MQNLIFGFFPIFLGSKKQKSKVAAVAAAVVEQSTTTFPTSGSLRKKCVVNTLMYED